jgi:hypothetical protein
MRCGLRSESAASLAKLELKKCDRGFVGMNRKALCLSLGAAIFGGFLLWAATGSQSFQECIHTRKDMHAYQALRHKDSIIVEAVGLRTQLHVACGFVAANKNNGALTALAGIVVAIFTGTLWWATRGMLRIADKQRADMLKAIKAGEIAARAAERSAEVGVEIPCIAIQGIEFLDTDAADVESKLQNPKVIVTIKNHGRTPAFIEREALCFRLGMALPHRLEYDFAIDHPAGKTIESEEIYRLGRTGLLPKFDNETISGILRGNNSLWIYGYIFYYDFLRELHWFNFRARFQIPPSLNGKTFEGAWHSEAPVRRDDFGPDGVE